MAFNPTGIPLGSMFVYSAQIPIDARYVVANATDRDDIPEAIRYEGLVTFVVDEGRKYLLKGGLTNGHWVSDGGVNLATDIMYDDSTGANVTLPSGAPSLVRITDEVESVGGIAAPAETDPAKILIVSNGWSDPVEFIDEDTNASAGARLSLPNDESIFLPQGGNLMFIYLNSRWRYLAGSVGGSGGGGTSDVVIGSPGTPASIDPAVGISISDISDEDMSQVIFIQGDASGEQNLDAAVGVVDHTVLNAKLEIYGASDTNTLMFDSRSNLKLVAPWLCTKDTWLKLKWMDTYWLEIGRG